jgi:hypothetical protein
MNATAPPMLAGSYAGHRPCPARADYVELVIKVGAERLNWCVPDRPAEVTDERTPDRLELRHHQSGVRLLGCFDDSDEELPVPAPLAIRLLGAGAVPILVDRRLVALHQ